VTRAYYDSGRLWTEESYKDNEPHGTSKEFYPGGEIKYIDTYKKGQKINRKTYDESGKLLSEQDYPTE
jgi:antitoxin component YwqK of YwqJK toxin-antitoxin module